MTEQSETEFVRAAGGLVWRDTGRGRELLVVHRAGYDDWSLPKGKLEPGESWPEAAAREVIEETGLAVSIQSFAGVTTYYHGQQPKVVLFWNMTLVDEVDLQPGVDEAVPEVDQVKWLKVDEALDQLTYPAEQSLVAQNQARKSAS